MLSSCHIFIIIGKRTPIKSSYLFILCRRHKKAFEPANPWIFRKPRTPKTWLFIFWQKLWWAFCAHHAGCTCFKKWMNRVMLNWAPQSATGEWALLSSSTIPKFASLTPTQQLSTQCLSAMKFRLNNVHECNGCCPSKRHCHPCQTENGNMNWAFLNQNWFHYTVATRGMRIDPYGFTSLGMWSCFWQSFLQFWNDNSLAFARCMTIKKCILKWRGLSARPDVTGIGCHALEVQPWLCLDHLYVHIELKSIEIWLKSRKTYTSLFFEEFW